MAKSAADRRKAQNEGVKDGTIRKGAGGKFMRRYNAKTGRWDVVSNLSVKTGGTTTARRETMAKKAETPKQTLKGERPSPKTAAAKARQTSSYKTATKAVQRKKTAQRRKTTSATIAGLSSPITAPLTLAKILGPGAKSAASSAAKSAKKWWEGY